MGVARRRLCSAMRRAAASWRRRRLTLAGGCLLAIVVAAVPASAAGPWRVGCWRDACQLWRQIVEHRDDGTPHTYAVGIRSTAAGQHLFFSSHPLLVAAAKARRNVTLGLDVIERFAAIMGGEDYAGPRVILEHPPSNPIPEEGTVQVPIAFLFDLLQARTLTVDLRDQRVTFDVADMASPVMALTRELARRREQPPADPRPTLVRW